MFDGSKADAFAEKLLGALNLGSLALMASIVPGLTERLEKGIWALDVGRGSGRILNRLAELYPNSRFVGIDVSPPSRPTSWRMTFRITGT